MADKLTTVTSAQPDVTLPVPNTKMEQATVDQMLNVLESLVSHTHVFYDDYGTACNCNCLCVCGTRGTF